MAAYLPDPYMHAHLTDLELRGHTPATLYSRRRALIRMTIALPVPLLEATPGQLMDWRRSLRIGPDAIAAYVSHARSYYRWAVRAGLIDENPAADLPAPKLSRRLPRPIPEDQLSAALTAPPPRIRPWLALAGWCGLRAREIAYLRRENVLELATPPMLLVDVDAAKGHGERTVPLCDFALAELRRAGLPAQGWVFRRADHQPGPNQPWLVSHLVNNYLHDMGIPATLHQLRHRFGSGTYQASKDIRLVQELLGHQRLSTTAGYAAYDSESGVAAVGALAVP